MSIACSKPYCVFTTGCARTCCGPGKADCFEDQYISSGGQLYELMAGRDRFVADLRPLMEKTLARRGLALGICAHPYDLSTELIAREMGVIVTDRDGRAAPRAAKHRRKRRVGRLCERAYTRRNRAAAPARAHAKRITVERALLNTASRPQARVQVFGLSILAGDQCKLLPAALR